MYKPVIGFMSEAKINIRVIWLTGGKDKIQVENQHFNVSLTPAILHFTFDSFPLWNFYVLMYFLSLITFPTYLFRRKIFRG